MHRSAPSDQGGHVNFVAFRAAALDVVSVPVLVLTCFRWKMTNILPVERVFARKPLAAELTLMGLFVQVNTVDVALKICFPFEFVVTIIVVTKMLPDTVGFVA